MSPPSLPHCRGQWWGPSVSHGMPSPRHSPSPAPDAGLAFEGSNSTTSRSGVCFSDFVKASHRDSQLL